MTTDSNEFSTGRPRPCGRRGPVLQFLLACGLFAAVLSTGAQPASEPSTPEEDSEPLDLTEFYGTVVGSEGDTWFSHEDWKSVPKGLQSFHGVLFDISGHILLRGQHALQLDTETPDIPVRGTHRYIHLLHGAGYREKNGTRIGSLVIKYTDGESAELPIVYGHHVRNWWKEPTEKHSGMEDPGTLVAWHGPGKTGFPAPPITLRLYQSAVPNPNPDREIQSIRLKSYATEITWCLISVSCGDSAPVVHDDGKETAPPP